MKKYIPLSWLLGLVLLLSGCTEEKPSINWNKEKTITVLVDLRLIDNQIKKHRHYQKDSVRQLYKKILLEMHQITEQELEENLRILQSDPTLALSYEGDVQRLLRAKLDELQGDDEEQ